MRELALVHGIRSDSSSCKFSPCCIHSKDKDMEYYDAPDLYSWSRVLTLCPNLKVLCLGGSLLHASDQMMDMIGRLVGGSMECISWRDLVLHRAVSMPRIQHLSCKVISQESLSSMLPSLCCLSCRGTTFTEWERLPHGFEKLDASSYTHVDLCRLLRAPAMQTITSLCVFCNEIPEVMDWDARLEHLQELRIHSRYPSRVNQQQLRVIQGIVQHCQLRLLALCLTKPEFLSNADIDSFFQSLPVLRSISLWSGWRINHVDEIMILVKNCPLLEKADIYFASLTDAGLQAMTGLLHLKELSMRRSLTRVTSLSFLRFIDLLFGRSLLFLWFGGPVTFSPLQQQELITIRNAYNLRIDFRKSFEEPSADDWFASPTASDLKVEHVRIRRISYAINQ